MSVRLPFAFALRKVSPPPLFASLLMMASLPGFAADTSVPGVNPAKPALVIALPDEPKMGFDPIKGWAPYGTPLLQSTLLKRDTKLNVMGDLATQWKLSSDRRTWTVALRQGVKFSDGHPLSADDVVFTFEAGKKAGDTLDLSNLESVRAVNAYTVEFRLAKPQVTFEALLADLGIVPRHAYGERYSRKPVGSGPFQLRSWTEGQQAILEPNPHYYGTRSTFQRITVLFTREDTTLAAARAGQLDLAALPNTLANAVPAGMLRVAVKTVDNRGLMFPVVPNSGLKNTTGAAIGNDVTADPAIRRAVNTALDRKLLASAVLNGFGVPAWGPADGLPWDNPAQRTTDANLPAARKILDDAGWEVGADGVREKGGRKARFSILYPASDSTRQALALAAADMVKPLGIQADVAGKSWDELKPLMHSNVVVFGWGSHNPQEIFNIYSGENVGKGFFNPGYFDNATVNRHLQEAQSSPTLEASLPHWRAAMWDGREGFGMQGAAAWAWMVNIDHVYAVNKCLDIGPRQIEPHGHGFPVAYNLQDWRWTCP